MSLFKTRLQKRNSINGEKFGKKVTLERKNGFTYFVSLPKLLGIGLLIPIFISTSICCCLALNTLFIKYALTKQEVLPPLN